MRLQAGLGPDALHAGVADAHLLGHRAHAPVRGVRRPFVRGLGDDLEAHRIGERRRARGPGLVAQQAIDAFSDETLLPAPYARFRFARGPHDRHLSEAVRRREHNVDLPHDLGCRIAIRDQLLEAKPLVTLRVMV